MRVALTWGPVRDHFTQGLANIDAYYSGSPTKKKREKKKDPLIHPD